MKHRGSYSGEHGTNLQNNPYKDTKTDTLICCLRFSVMELHADQLPCPHASQSRPALQRPYGPPTNTSCSCFASAPQHQMFPPSLLTDTVKSTGVFYMLAIYKLFHERTNDNVVVCLVLKAAARGMFTVFKSMH